MNFSGEKMSKSKSNFIRLIDLEEGISPLAVRYNMYTVNYRKTAEFSMESLKASQVALDNLYQFIQRLLKLSQLVLNKKIEINFSDENKANMTKFEEAFFTVINNDFDMPSSLEIIWNFIKEFNKNPMGYDPQSVLGMFYNFEKVLGLKLDNISLDNIPTEIEKLAEER